MSFRIVVPFNVGVMVAAESSFERNAAKKCSVGMGQSMAVFVTQGIPQSGPRSTNHPLEHLADRNSGDVDISARSIPTPTEGESAPTQVDINRRQLLVEKTMGLQLSLHVGDSSIEAIEGDDIHGGNGRPIYPILATIEHLVGHKLIDGYR